MNKAEEEKIQAILKKCEVCISKIMKKSIPISYTKKTGKILNGNAKKKDNSITLTGNWSDLASDDSKTANSALIALYYVIGHELGHLDQEPSIIDPTKSFLGKVSQIFLSLFRKDFRCQIRELRADYCGILFTLCSLDGFNISDLAQRRYVISHALNYLIRKRNKDVGDSIHPRFSKRKEILIKNPIFNKELISSLSGEYSCTPKEVKQLCSCAFNGTLLSIQNRIAKSNKCKLKY